MTPLEQWRHDQHEHRILTSDFAAEEFYGRVSERPLRLLREYVGLHPLGGIDDIKAANRRLWKARHRDTEPSST